MKMNRRQFLMTIGFTAGSLAACTVPPPPVRTGMPGPVATANGAVNTPTGAKQTLTIGSVEEPDTLHPFISYMFTTQKIMFGVMSPLVNFDANLNMVPALAESYTVSADGLTYTLNLNKKAKWHDGVPFTSADIVATWKIILNPDFGANGPFGWDKVKSIDTPDPNTAVVTMTAPFAPFLALTGNWLIAPKHLIDKGVNEFKQQYGRNPIGTGPYKFAKWDSGQQIVLEKNPEYFGETPKIDRLVFKFVPDTNTLITQLQTGEVQMTDALSAVDFESVKALPDKNAQALLGVNWTQINLKNIDHLMDKRVRQALDFATPKQQIVDQLLKGLAEVAVADQSPITPYFNTDIKPRPYDLDKAAALLSEAGFTKNSSGILEKGGKPLSIEYWIGTGDQQAKLVSQVVIASWRKLGIDVSEHEQDIRVWMTADGFLFRKTMTAGQFEWFNSIDPDDTVWWHSSVIPKQIGGVGSNFPAVFNKFEQQAKFDELISAGAAESDPAKRKKIYWEIQELLHEEMPVIFLYWGKRVFVAPKNLKYTTNSAMPLLFNAETWQFEQ